MFRDSIDELLYQVIGDHSDFLFDDRIDGFLGYGPCEDLLYIVFGEDDVPACGPGLAFFEKLRPPVLWGLVDTAEKGDTGAHFGFTGRAWLIIKNDGGRRLLVVVLRCFDAPYGDWRVFRLLAPEAARDREIEPVFGRGLKRGLRLGAGFGHKKGPCLSLCVPVYYTRF